MEKKLVVENDSPPVEVVKKAWSTPTLEAIAVEETQGNGGGGPDFGSELS